MEARFSAPAQIGPGAHTASSGVKRPGRGVNHPPHLKVRWRRSTAVPLLHLCAFMADYWVNSTFSPLHLCQGWSSTFTPHTSSCVSALRPLQLYLFLFVFRRCPLRILARIPTEFSYHFPITLRVNVGITPQIKPCSFRSTS